MANSIDRRTSTKAQLESAQDAFVIALRRLRALEEAAAQLRSPVDLEHAHELWSRLALLPRIGASGTRAANLDDEVRAARSVFQQVREALRLAEAEATLAA